MSSLSRRACYKCGNVGHYAGQSRRDVTAALPADECLEVCTSTERLCYNCMEPLP